MRNRMTALAVLAAMSVLTLGAVAPGITSADGAPIYLTGTDGIEPVYNTEADGAPVYLTGDDGGGGAPVYRIGTDGLEPVY